MRKGLGSSRCSNRGLGLWRCEHDSRLLRPVGRGLAAALLESCPPMVNEFGGAIEARCVALGNAVLLRRPMLHRQRVPGAAVGCGTSSRREQVKAYQQVTM